MVYANFNSLGQPASINSRFSSVDDIHVRLQFQPPQDDVMVT